VESVSILTASGLGCPQGLPRFGATPKARLIPPIPEKRRLSFGYRLAISCGLAFLMRFFSRGFFYSPSLLIEEKLLPLEHKPL
jgi:hypothetical protein